MTHNKRIQKLEIEWIVESPLKIGPEGKDPEYDLPIQKITLDGQKVPYIPGSSIKGVLRSAVEKELKYLKLRNCDILNPQGSCGGSKKNKISQLQRRNDTEGLKNIVNGFCMACKLFGSHYFRGRVRIRDAYPKKQKQSGRFLVTTGDRPGIAIDRLHGSVMKHALFQTEYVAKGSRFLSTVICEDLSDVEFALFIKTLFNFNLGRLRLGGLTTTGFGKVKVKILNFENYEYNIGDNKENSDQQVSEDNVDNVLNKRLYRWAIRVWKNYIEEKKLYPQQIPELEIPMVPDGEGEDQAQTHRLKVLTVTMAQRDVIYPAHSGTIHGYIILKEGYRLHVGSGKQTLPTPPQRTEIRKIIDSVSGFNEALKKLQPYLDKIDPYEIFAYQMDYSHGTAKREFVIPGSTLKGLFRSRLEHMFVNVGNHIDSCLVKTGNDSSTISSVYRKLYGINGTIHRREACTDLRKHCVVCDIFGMSSQDGGLKGLVDFSDAILDKGTPKGASIGVSSGGTAYMYVVENPPDSKAMFKFTVRYRNLDDIRLGLLMSALATFETNGIRVGRFKYREYADEYALDFGRAKVQIVTIDKDDGEIMKDIQKIAKFCRDLKNKAREAYGSRLRILKEEISVD